MHWRVARADVWSRRARRCSSTARRPRSLRLRPTRPHTAPTRSPREAATLAPTRCVAVSTITSARLRPYPAYPTPRREIVWISVLICAGIGSRGRGRGSGRSHRSCVTYRRGDWVELAESVPPAAIVTFDRVIQRYPDLELAGLSVERARRLYGSVYPRDTYREARRRRAEPHPALAPKAGPRLCPSGRPDRAGCSRERSQPLLLSKRRTCVAG